MWKTSFASLIVAFSFWQNFVDLEAGVSSDSETSSNEDDLIDGKVFVLRTYGFQSKVLTKL